MRPMAQSKMAVPSITARQTDERTGRIMEVASACHKATRGHLRC